MMWTLVKYASTSYKDTSNHLKLGCLSMFATTFWFYFYSYLEPLAEGEGL